MKKKKMAGTRVTIATYRSVSAARAARDALREAGIEAWLGNDSPDAGTEPRSFLQLWVAEEDRAAALEILGSATRPAR